MRTNLCGPKNFWGMKKYPHPEKAALDLPK
jgi:hypothetical protein